MRSGWLLRDGDVVCALEMTDSFAERIRGLRGSDGCEGALHMPGARAYTAPVWGSRSTWPSSAGTWS